MVRVVYTISTRSGIEHDSQRDTGQMHISCPVRRAPVHSCLAAGQARRCPGCKKAHASLCAGARVWTKEAVQDASARRLLCRGALRAHSARI